MTDIPNTSSAPSASRRAALKIGLGAALAGLLPRQAAFGDNRLAPQQAVALKPVADPDPIVDARFPSEIARDVWLIPDRRINLIPNIGIIVGKKKALIVDCGLGPESGRQVLEAARRLAPGRELVLTQTHAHPEHAFGAVALKDHVEIFLNRAQNDYLTRSGPAMLTYFRSFGPNVAHFLEGVEVVPATTTYEGAQATLDLGGRRVEFRNWGTAHSPGDQTIFLPDENILFAGDLIEERMIPIVPYLPPHITKADINTAQWTKVLTGIEQSKPAIIVPGHGNLGRAEVARSVREWLAAVQSRVAAAAADGGVEGKVPRLMAEIQAMHPAWEFPARIEWAVNYFAPGWPGSDQKRQ